LFASAPSSLGSSAPGGRGEHARTEKSGGGDGGDGGDDGDDIGDCDSDDDDGKRRCACRGLLSPFSPLFFLLVCALLWR
jgi:hypothetical protein